MVSRDTDKLIGTNQMRTLLFRYPKSDVNIVFADTLCSLTPFDLSLRRKVQEILHSAHLNYDCGSVYSSNQQLWSTKLCFLHEQI
jgi:hypothetical protein